MATKDKLINLEDLKVLSDHVEGEVTDLKSELSDIGVVLPETSVPLTYEYGKTIVSDGSIGSTGGNYVLNRGNVIAGKTYSITGTNNFTQPIYAFYDSTNTVVSLGEASSAGSAWTEITDKKVIAPTGATYILIEGRYSVFDSELKEVSDVYTYPRVDALENDCEEVKEAIGTIIDKTVQVELTNTSGALINSNGVITSASGYNIKRGNVTAGKTYFVTGSSNWANPFYAFYASDDSLIALGTSSAVGSTVTSTENEEVTAPIGATYIVINWIGSGLEANCYVKDGKTLAKKWYGKKWVCIGDSLTDNNQHTTKHYFDYVADASNIQPINMGDSGTGYKRGYDSNRAFYQRIQNIDTSADVVTIFGSFNDIGAGYDLGVYTDTGTETIAGCINTTIDNLQTLIPTIILGIVAPTPWATARPDFHTSADNYVNMLKKIAEHRSIPYLDLFRCSNLRPWDEDFRTLCYSKDGGYGVHPNELGQQIIAPKFMAFLDMLLL